MMIKLNLLPPEEKKELKLAKIGCLTVRFNIYFFISLLVFATFLASALLYLSILIQSQGGVMEIGQDDEKAQTLLELEDKIKQANQIIDQVYLKQKDLFLWTPLLEELSKITPDGVYLTDFSYHSSNNRVNLKGRAETRENLLYFQELLEKSQYSSEVVSPLSNLLKQKDIDFNFSFKPVVVDPSEECESDE